MEPRSCEKDGGRETRGSIRHKDAVFEKYIFKCQMHSTYPLDFTIWKGITNETGMKQPQENGGNGLL